MATKVRQGFDKAVKEFKGVLNRLPDDPIKKSCFILAIINSVANGLLFLSCIYVEYRIFTYKPSPSSGFLLGGIHWGRTKRDAIDDQIRDEYLPVLWLIMLITAGFSIATVILSAMVCRGIRNRRPGLVQAYFVYGVIITIMILLMSIIHLSIIGDKIGLGIGGLVGCALHSAYLVLVYKTFKKLQYEVRFPIPIIMQQVPILPSAPPVDVITDDEKYYSALSLT